MDDSVKKLEELKNAAYDIQDAVLFSANEIKKAIQDNGSSHEYGLASVQVQYAITESRDILRIMDVHLADGLGRIEAQVFRNNITMINATQLLADTIAKTADSSADRVVVAFSDLPVQKTVQNTPIAGTQELIPEELEKKLGLVLDSAAGFLKAWSNPVNVGVALAIPIIAGVGLIVGGVVIIFNKLVDAVVDISHSVRSIAEGGLKGLVFGQSVPTASEPKREAPTFDSTPIVKSIESSRNSIVTPLAGILTAVNAMSAKAEELGMSLKSLNIGRDVADSIEKMNAAIQDSTRRMSAMLISAPQSENMTGAQVKDKEFQSEVISLLKSTLNVRIEGYTQDSQNGEIKVDVFAEAVKPLVRGQESLNRMLDSNLRKLVEAVHELKNVPSANDRVTEVKDTVNTEMSSAASDYILSETKEIKRALLEFKSSFDAFKNFYQIMNKTGSSESSSDGSKIANLSGD